MRNRILFGVVLLACGGRGVAAQPRGIVTDSISRTPIVGAVVTL
jgi:hypothetical protein